MATENSVLKSTKKMLGLDENYNAFDLDVITHINSVFLTLKQLGIGPDVGFMIEDDTATWNDFEPDISLQNAAKSYTYLRVRLLFDPPGDQPALLNALKEQVTEFEHRLKIEREVFRWTPSSSSPSLP